MHIKRNQGELFRVFYNSDPPGTARYLELIDTPVWLRGSVRWSYVKVIF